jgi:hypothetical protein
MIIRYSRIANGKNLAKDGSNKGAKMKEFKFDEKKYTKLTEAQRKMVIKKGYTWGLTSNGQHIKITKDDLFVTKESYEKITKEIDEGKK